MKVAVCVCILFLSGCAHTSWLRVSAIEMGGKKTPEELMQILGEPFTIVRGQKLSWHQGDTQEYRYFFINRSDRIGVLLYFYDGTKWLTTIMPEFDFNEREHIKVISPTDERYATLFRNLWKKWPRLKPPSENEVSRKKKGGAEMS